MTTETDWTDPCAAAAVIRTAYYSLLAGEQVTSVRIGDRMVTYKAADMASLKEELARLDEACSAAKGKAPRRYAMRLGSRGF